MARPRRVVFLLRASLGTKAEQGAGDQGLMFGYASVFNPLEESRKVCRLAPSQCPRYAPATKATLSEPEIVTRNGKPVSVILPIAEYRELIERAEDADDVAWLKRARQKPPACRPLGEYLAARKAK